MRRHRERGANTIEFTLVGIPLLFMLISIFEISRGMWMYETAAHSVREGVRFAIVHGRDCETTPSINNNCTTTVAGVTQVIRNAGVGLDPDSTTLTFIAPAPLPPGGTAIQCTITTCAADNSQWPPSGSNNDGTAIQIDVITPFNSALAMFWPGAGAVSFSQVNLGASSTDIIQF